MIRYCWDFGVVFAIGTGGSTNNDNEFGDGYCRGGRGSGAMVVGGMGSVCD